MRQITLNDITLNFKTAGSGQQIFILIHNAGGNHRFMDNQFHYYSQQGKVVSVDLRGHGGSDKPEQSYTVEGFAEDILHISKELSISKAVVIGLNYGAAVTIELANMVPELVSQCVVIDPPILMESWVEQLVKDHIDELKDPHLQNYAENLVDSVLANGSHENKLMAIDAFNTVSKKALISTYENLIEWDKISSPKIQKCKMPVLNIQSSHPFCREKTLLTLCPHLVSGKVVNSGPWATLEVPEQVNAMIDRFFLSDR